MEAGDATWPLISTTVPAGTLRTTPAVLRLWSRLSACGFCPKKVQMGRGATPGRLFEPAQTPEVHGKEEGPVVFDARLAFPRCPQEG